MPRRWRGVLAVEGEQTGDGRVIAEGALTWADLPIPLAWLIEEQHGDLLPGAVQVGTIDSITRDGNLIMGAGDLDDAQEDGAEVVRRMEAGTAPFGSRFGVSIDPDDYELQVVATEQMEEEGVVIVASGGTLPSPVVVAAAGDPDPGDGGGENGDLLFEDSVDTIIMRFTRLRIRGATLCAVPAFSGAYVELDDSAPVETAEQPEGEGEEGEGEAVTAAAAPTRPPADWFALDELPAGDERYVEQPDGGMAVPLTITDDGHVFGHLARWGQCHTGYPGACVEPPESMRAYADFMVGEVVCDDGSRVATGVLTVGCDHAAARALAAEARDHYAHAGLGWADVRVSNGELGAWVAGALRPGIADDVVRVLRASSLSGDWRRIGGNLELIAALSVNSPGFPIAREALAAASLPAPAELTAAQVGMVDDEQVSLLAAGAVQRCADCAARARAQRELRVGVELADSTRQLLEATNELMQQVGEHLSQLDLRTRHLVPEAATALMARIRR